jgi:4-hydroxybenzoate polyprenyltransferase
MTIAVFEPVPLTLLRLGRVSNLPTVWTNVLAGAVLAGADWHDWRLAPALIAMSLLYVGGMYLNDYFDRTIDARERPQRPIPSGAIRAGAVAAAGFGLLGAGTAMAAMMGFAAAAVALLLAAAIVAYDRWHKGNPFAPLLMGACRALVYCAAAAALTQGIPLTVVIAAIAAGAYVAGLTYAAQQENLDTVGNLWPLLLLAAPLVVALGAWRHGVGAIAIYLAAAAWMIAAVYLLARRPFRGSVPRAVGWLIAGISLVDAALLASAGALAPALVAVAGCAATLLSQRYIAGT